MNTVRILLFDIVNGKEKNKKKEKTHAITNNEAMSENYFF